MRDITLGDTFYHFFTTRAFATGVPGTLSGTPVLSVLEENNVTPITAGVSVQVDRASVVGLNQATIVATGANGYEAGKSYAIYISTGTVGGTSVVGEVVGEFTIQLTHSGIKKNVAMANFKFLMTDSTNHAPATGLTVTVTRAIDDGAFAAGTLSAVTEVAFGIYRVDFGAGDLNGDNITFRATAAASDDLLVTIETDP